MYRFVFYHVSPVSVVKFIPFSCEMYAILFHADFFCVGKQGKMYVYIEVGSALSL